MSPDPSAAPDPQELLPLSPPAYHVLLALGDRTLHGYAIMRTFEDLTAGEEHLLPGTLYATMARMVETGLIEEADAPDAGGDPRRRYYRMTEWGRRVASAESQRMRRLLELAAAQRMLPERA